MTASIFAPTKMGPHSLQNRVVMNPMTRSRADVDAVPTPIMAEYYGQRGTAGLIVTEGTAPSPNGRGYARTPGLWNDAQVAGWTPVTAAAHAKGAKIFAQIMHTGRVSHAGNMPEGAKIVAPSAIALAGQMYTDAAGMQDYPVPQEMTEADIQQAKAEFVTAAKNAIAAGFDGVELHAANGYLLEQFISPDTNKRVDGWGGSVANRSRFLLEVAQEVVAAIGGDKVGVRISPYGMASGMAAYAEVDETYLALMARLAEIGLIYVHLVDHAAMGNPAIPAEFRAKLKAAWPRTFIVGGSVDAASAQAAVDAGAADLVGFGRAFIANPDLVARMQAGASLAAPDSATFYTPGEKGYTDYPALG
ncbi:alkene reductase [Cypionkella aquatica]|uniref:Alkene reductase n=1 Tax=Cypionkella aquatica TaxID=1756042 RepID=A0AA37U036_9RHOB|nr:alkene reductase [Cypionkella aquatica]GLS85420.1 alkene reductase [Cypionkella aquatica]